MLPRPHRVPQHGSVMVSLWHWGITGLRTSLTSSSSRWGRRGGEEGNGGWQPQCPCTRGENRRQRGGREHPQLSVHPLSGCPTAEVLPGFLCTARWVKRAALLQGATSSSPRPLLHPPTLKEGRPARREGEQHPGHRVGWEVSAELCTSTVLTLPNKH